MSTDLRAAFEDAGYPLLTKEVSCPGLLEVYPHPALIELAEAKQRLQYKAAKVSKYWRTLTPAQRHVRLAQEWSTIEDLLEAEISGVKAALPPIASCLSGAQRKSYEDTLDAIICVWIGICVLEGRAIPFGDEDSAIWIPRPRSTWPTIPHAKLPT